MNNWVYDGRALGDMEAWKAEPRENFAGQIHTEAVQSQAVPVEDRDPSRQLRPTIRARATLMGSNCPVRPSRITRPICVREPNRQAGVDKVGKMRGTKGQVLPPYPKQMRVRACCLSVVWCAGVCPLSSLATSADEVSTEQVQPFSAGSAHPPGMV